MLSLLHAWSMKSRFAKFALICITIGSSISCFSDAQAALPSLPHTGAVLANLGTRISVKLDIINGISESLCSREYKPVAVQPSTRLEIGTEIYLVKRWFCTSQKNTGTFDSISIQAEHPEFHSWVTLNVYPGSTVLVEDHSARPLIVDSTF